MSRRGQRGTTILEVMLASAILLVATLGFAGSAITAASATAVAHRRSVASFFRTGLLDRYAVTARSEYAKLPAGTWIVDGCYDKDSQLIAPANSGYSTTFACPDTSVYRSWVRLAGGAAGPWTLSVYAERIDPGCVAADRYANIACVAADLYVTD